MHEDFRELLIEFSIGEAYLYTLDGPLFYDALAAGDHDAFAKLKDRVFKPVRDPLCHRMPTLDLMRKPDVTASPYESSPIVE